VHQPKNPLRKGYILVICLPMYVCVGIFLALIFSIAAPCFSQGIPSLNNAESIASKKSNSDESIELPGLNKLIEEPFVTRVVSNNQITLLQNAEAYFPAIETALDRAVHEIYLESYIFKNDNTGRRIAEALRRAALRGVKTHVLVDGFGSNGLPKTMVEFLEAAGVMVLKFRPKISPWTIKRQRLRHLHRKIVVVDRKIAFVGGINLIDDMDMPNETSPRYDYAVRVEGPCQKKFMIVRILLA